MDKFLKRILTLFIASAVFISFCGNSFADETLAGTVKKILGLDLIIKIGSEQGQFAELSSSYAHYMMGVIYDNQNKPEQAKQEFLQAKELTPGKNKISLRLASICIKLNQYD